MQIHELNNFLGSIDNSYLAMDDGTDTGKITGTQLLGGVNAEIEQLDTSLNARIDNIIAGGTAPSAAEVTDARHGADSLGAKDYTSLGAAIRGQADELADWIESSPIGVNDSIILKDGTPVLTENIIITAPTWFSTSQTQVGKKIAEISLSGNTVYYFHFGGASTPAPAVDKWFNLLISEGDANGNTTQNTITAQGQKYIKITTAATTEKASIYIRCNYTSIAAGANYPLTVYMLEAWTGKKEINDGFIDVVDPTARAAAKVYMNDDSFSLSIMSISELLTFNGFLNVSGQYNSNIYYKATDYIRVKQGQTIKYNLRDPATIAMICFYTERNEASFVSYVPATGSYSSGTFTAPSNGYIRACTEDFQLSLAYLYTELEPNKYNFGNKPIEKDLNVLLMGDSIFGNDGEIAANLNELCKSCVNGAFGGTQVTVRPYTSDDFRFFDGVNIITALCNQVWTDQDTAAAALASTYPWITSRLAGLKAVDMSDIDLLIMDWGTNDYTAGLTIEDINTAYGTVIDLLQTTYPELRILVSTPIWRYWGTESDNENGDTKVYNVSTLKEIALAIEDFMKDKRISVLNAYQNLPLSYKTASTYFDSGDKTHLNAFGNKVYAELIHGKIRSIY